MRTGIVMTALVLLTCASCGSSVRTDANSEHRAKKPGTRIGRVERGVLPAVVVAGETGDATSITAMMERLSIPGVSLAVVDGGRIVWSRAYGVGETEGDALTVDHLFQAASVSKPVVAMAALSLVAEGRLDLDEDVNRYLTSWRVPENEFTRDEKVTLRRLLSHTAGVSSFSTDDGGQPGEAPILLEILNGEPPAESGPVTVDLIPGSERRYSNEGYAIVQQLLIDVAGKPFPRIMRERVLDPLGMWSSTFEQPPPSRFLPRVASGHVGEGEPIEGKGLIYHNLAAGGLWTTPADLARFVMEVQRAAAGVSDRVLDCELASLMLHDPACGYGLGLGAGGEGAERTFGHSGHNAGFLCRIKGTVENGRGLVVMANSNRAIPLLEGITFAVAREYDWPPAVAPREVAAVALDEDTLRAYTGEYMIGDYVVTIGLERGRLTISHFEGEDILIPVSETAFLQQLDGIELMFVRDDAGRVESISLMGGRLTLMKRE